MNWYSWLVSTKLFLSFGSISYKLFKNCLNFTILFGIWTKDAIYSFKFIVTQNFSVMSFILMIMVKYFFLYHTSLMYVMSHLWCDFISPPFLLILNLLSKSCMFDTHFGLQKTVSVESMSNRISSFVFMACANEQCNPEHPITGSSFLLDKLLLLMLLLPSFLECTWCWALFITHSSFVIFSLVLHYGDLCPGFPQK